MACLIQLSQVKKIDFRHCPKVRQNCFILLPFVIENGWQGPKMNKKIPIFFIFIILAVMAKVSYFCHRFEHDELKWSFSPLINFPLKIDCKIAVTPTPSPQL